MLAIIDAVLGAVPKWVWAALVAALAATSCKLKWDNQGLSIEIEKGKTYVAQLETSIAQSNEASEKALAENTRKAREAEQSARIRLAALNRDAASARSERDRLQLALQAYTTSLTSGQKPSASGYYTNPTAELLLTCTDRYIDLAAKADGHANDVKTLIDAWPK